MRASFFDSLAQCEFGDWIGIGVLIAIGAFSVTFLIMACALLGRCLFEGIRHKKAGPT